MSAEKIQIRVRGEEYERFGGGGLFIKTYKSIDERKIWEKLLDVYGDMDEESAPTIEEIISNINESKGDGRDALFSIEKLVDGAWVPVEGFESIVEELEEDLDEGN